MERSEIVLKIMDEQDISYGKATVHLNELVDSIHYIVCFYKYYEWVLENYNIPDVDLTHYQLSKIIGILDAMPFYKKDPVLNVRAFHIIYLSKRSLFREFCRANNVKYKIEQVMFCSTYEIGKLNSVLTTRGKYDLNIHTY